MTSVNCQSVLACLKSGRADFNAAVATFKAIPGLYAFWVEPPVWITLNLGAKRDDRPLYVGKSESSLISRPLCQHFGHIRVAGRTPRASSITGWSSPRRSLAALLRKHLDLKGIPRDTRKPAYFDRFGLCREQDEQLTTWMREKVRLSVWYWDQHQPLKRIEEELVAAWQPPLNVSRGSPWFHHLDRERRAMAAEAETWAAETKTRRHASKGLS
jgi:hypothetical protein